MYAYSPDLDVIYFCIVETRVSEMPIHEWILVPSSSLSLSLNCPLLFLRHPTRPPTTSARCRRERSITSLSFRWCSCFSSVHLGCALSRIWRWSFLC